MPPLARHCHPALPLALTAVSLRHRYDAGQGNDVQDSPSAEKPDIIAAEITYDTFRQVDIRVGTVITADAFPEARRPAFKLTIDFGAELGQRRSSAQITKHYTAEQLIGRQVAAVVNFPKKQIGKFMSEVLVLGFPDSSGEVVLISPSQPVPNGGRLF